MNKLSFLTLTAVLLLFTNHSFAMQPEDQQNKIKLISSDEKEFVIPKNVAEQSLFIKTALASGMKEAEEGIIRFKELDGNVVQLATELLIESAQAANEKELIALTAKTLKNYDISYDVMKDLLPTMVDFLAIQKLEVPLVNYTVTKFFKDKPIKAVENDIKKVSSKDVRSLLAKYYYFIYGSDRNFVEVDANYGFSIQELIAYSKLIPIRNVSGWNILDLKQSKINNLIGLKNIPNFEKLNILDLSHNNIETIEPNIFSGLDNLQILALDHNKIKTIETKTFKNLNNLTKLDLSHNNIETIEPDFFPDHNNLIKLNLRNNPLSDSLKKELQKQFGKKIRF